MHGLAALVDRYELAQGERLAAKLSVVACDGGASDEPCFFPQCLVYGCPGEPADPTGTPTGGPGR